MSDPHAEHITSHPPAGHAAALPFSDEQWREFHKSDIGAGGAIVVLMTAIFSIGLVLYTVIAIVVSV